MSTDTHAGVDTVSLLSCVALGVALRATRKLGFGVLLDRFLERPCCLTPQEQCEAQRYYSHILPWLQLWVSEHASNIPMPNQSHLQMQKYLFQHPWQHLPSLCLPLTRLSSLQLPSLRPPPAIVVTAGVTKGLQGPSSPSRAAQSLHPEKTARKKVHAWHACWLFPHKLPREYHGGVRIPPRLRFTGV